MIDRVAAVWDWLVPSARDESETKRDGFLSTRREIHVAVIGLTVGVVCALAQAWELAGLFVFATLGSKLTPEHLSGLRREPWYALGMFLIGVGGVRCGPALVDLVATL